jgi:hypothetical protein
MTARASAAADHRRGAGPVVTWRRARMMLLSAVMSVVKLADVTFTSAERSGT